MAKHSIIIVGPAGSDRATIARIVARALELAKDSGVRAAAFAEVFDEDTTLQARTAEEVLPTC